MAKDGELDAKWQTARFSISPNKSFATSHQKPSDERGISHH